MSLFVYVLGLHEFMNALYRQTLLWKHPGVKLEHPGVKLATVKNSLHQSAKGKLGKSLASSSKLFLSKMVLASKNFKVKRAV